MTITPKAIQDLLDELESSKQSRLRAWNVLQRLRLVLSDSGNVAIPPPAHDLPFAHNDGSHRDLAHLKRPLGATQRLFHPEFVDTYSMRDVLS